MSDKVREVDQIRLGDVSVHAEPGLHPGTGVVSIGRPTDHHLVVAWRQLREAEAALASAAAYLRHARQNLQRTFPEVDQPDTPTSPA